MLDKPLSELWSDFMTFSGLKRFKCSMCHTKVPEYRRSEVNESMCTTCSICYTVMQIKALSDEISLLSEQIRRRRLNAG